MTPERWQRIESLFEAVLERSPEQRAGFLDLACGDDSALRRALDEMIAADGQADHDLKGAILEGVRLLEDDRIRQLGPYRLLRRIGAGGMGQVYLAERADEEYEQRVAVKLVRPGADGRRILERFRRERQILASLEHPHIARLLDGGTAPDGRPYLVMEHIDGLPIDRYSDRHQLGLRPRLELFLTICQAVQHAHQHLIVHRDLKPGNILITTEGTVKLLDFGIAKILKPAWHGGLADPTTTASQPLTWSYASPEQILGERVTTASDVYSLGVVLYQLLTGERPVELGEAAPAEALRRICELRPTPPSSSVAAQGRLGLARRLRGDLDAITLTALHRDRSRRYGSAMQLADDVRRYLEGWPVEAHPDRLAYRARKFLRRNRWPVAAGLIFAILAAAFGVSRSQQAARIAQERDKAREVVGFLVDLFRVSDPRRSRGETLTVRAMLDEGAARIPRGLGDNAVAGATLSHTIGRVYRELGLYDSARPLLEDALAVRRAELGRQHPDVAESLTVLGGLAKAEGDYETAERQHSEALAIYRQRLGNQRPEVAEVLNELALVLRSQGRFGEAESLFREALAIYRASGAEDHDAAVTTLGNLALVLENRQDYGEAERLMRQTLRRSREIDGEPHPLVATHLNNLGFILERRGDYAGAEPIYRQALAMRRQVLDPQHPEVLESLNNLGAVLCRRGDFTAAEAPLAEALEVARGSLGDDHPELAPLLNNLALVRKRQRDYAGAEELYRQSVALQRRHLGEDHPAYATGLDNLASLLLATGDLGGAETLYQQASEARLRVLGPDHPDSATSLVNLARLASRRGDHGTAAELQRRALAIRRAKLGEEHPKVASSLSLLAESLAAGGHRREAEELYRRAVAMRRQLLGPDHPLLAASLTGLGETLVGEPAAGLDEAEELLREALAIRRRELGEEHPLTAATQSVLGGCLAARGRFAEAEPLLLDSYRRLETLEDGDPRPARAALERLIALYEAQGRDGEAAAFRARRSEPSAA